MDTTPTHDLLTVPEVCDRLRIGRSQVFVYLHTGALRSISLGRRRLVTRAALDAFIAKCEAEGGAKWAAI